MTIRTLRRRAILAIVLPLLAVTVSYAVDIRSTYHVLVHHPLLFWASVALLMGAAWLEVQCMAALVSVLTLRLSLRQACDAFNDPACSHRRRQRRFRLAATALALFLSLALSEICFRILDIQVHRAPHPHADALRVNNSRNSLGLRERWEALSDDDRRLRIAFLGDSITYGEGVEPDQCFCRLIEGLLDDAVPQGVVTINMGEPGTGPKQQWELYQRRGSSLHPDLVVHVVYPNDWGLALTQKLQEIYRIRDSEIAVAHLSYVLRFAEKQIRYWAAWNATIDYFQGGADEAQRRATWEQLRSDLIACRTAVRAGGAEYAVVLFPWLVRLDDYLLNDVHAQLRGFALEFQVPYLDLLDVFQGRNGSALRISDANEHPNPEGHRIAAGAIARFLRESVLPGLPRPAASAP